ncbi:putative glcB [Mycobacterium xenopi 3993]|nr:putative glcB [Mycobacterium xenopi 3993]
MIAYARRFLDDAVPLGNGSWSELTGLAVDGGQLVATLADGLHTTLANPPSSPATPVLPRRRIRCCWSTTGCTSTS